MLDPINKEIRKGVSTKRIWIVIISYAVLSIICIAVSSLNVMEEVRSMYWYLTPLLGPPFCLTFGVKALGVYIVGTCFFFCLLPAVIYTNAVWKKVVAVFLLIMVWFGFGVFPIIATIT